MATILVPLPTFVSERSNLVVNVLPATALPELRTTELKVSGVPFVAVIGVVASAVRSGFAAPTTTVFVQSTVTDELPDVTVVLAM
jgi:hypothetical protein